MDQPVGIMSGRIIFIRVSRLSFIGPDLSETAILQIKS